MPKRAKAKFALILVGSYALAFIPAALVSTMVWVGLRPEERTTFGAVVTEHAGPLVGLAIVSLAAHGLLLWVLFQMYVAAPLALAQGTRLVTHGNLSHRLEPVGGPEMQELARAINGLAHEHETLRHEVEARIADAQKKVHEERDRLAAIISEATQAVLVCNLEGRILLYNRRATQLLGQAPGATPAIAGAGLVGLARSVFAILERNLIAHALETIQARREKGTLHPVAGFVTAIGGQLLRVHVAPVLHGARASPYADEGAAHDAGESAITGFVLRIDDITKPLEAGRRTEAILQSLTDASRRALANIRAAVETLLGHPGMEPETQARFVGVIHEEAAALSTTLDRTAPDLTSLRTEWLLEDMLGSDLVSAARSSIESTLGLPTVEGAVDPAVWLKVESYSLVRAIVSIAARLKREGVRDLRLALEPEGRHAHLDLAWSGADIATETLARWEDQPIGTSGEPFPLTLTLKEVLERHDGAVWVQASRASATGFFRLVVPVTEAEQAPLVLPAAAGGRPEYYDFDLFRQAGQTPELDERKLTSLAYTVFDTETTGLSPSDGDEIMSIGAVRIVNGRLLHQEAFEQFVDPRRPVSLAAIQITGIDPAFLAGKPPIEQVLPQFHRFCEDTVLVAHNGAFDMRFLQIKEAVAGVRFTHPVLDTLLLAAVIQPNLPSIGLEGIAERFGVPVLGRHTALGDAIMTGEIFLRMVPLLAERGIVTLRDAREASRWTYISRVKY
jgi:DNA polymerase-3 subunit epsilon